MVVTKLKMRKTPRRTRVKAETGMGKTDVCLPLSIGSPCYDGIGEWIIYYFITAQSKMELG
jgi:hypothetical protein